MKVSIKTTSKVEKFQEGGPVPAQAAPEQAVPAEAGAPEGGQDPVAQLVQLAQQALSSKDCQAAMAVCDGLMQMLQSQGGGAPAEAPQGAPVYKKGGILIKRIK